MRRKQRLSVLAVGFGASAFAVAFALGTALTAGTGIPLIGGVVNGVLVSMILTIGLLSLNRFGIATIMWLTFGLCAFWSTTLGPPGLYKIVIAVLAGLIWDTVYVLFRKSTAGLFIGAILAAVAIMLLLIGALWLGLGEGAGEALQKYQQAFLALLAVNLVVTALGVLLGRQVYQTRLRHLRLFKSFRDDYPESR